ncbi:hypothetical protein GIV19_04430 [Pseudomonas syringae]|uniref:hypothetical protein n=1 Tax=Pseudomonas syringae TaxID=317 RepID=UPI001F41D505|nr:hypothetical protein [Pseudomonas syringae]MCF5706534.1 hypothetical protein [Pseudomonas syringae]
MSSNTSVGNSVLHVLATPSRVAAAVFIPLLMISTLSLARDGVLSFHGSVVNASCEVSTSTLMSSGQSLTVAPGVVIQIIALKDACGDETTPFVANYRALSSSPVSLTAERTIITARSGVVTLT